MENIKKLIVDNPSNAPVADLYEALAKDVLAGLNVDLVTIWEFDEHHNTLECQYSIDRFKKLDLKGFVLRRKDCPIYFKAIIEGVSIRATDVYTDIKTKELIKAYFVPNGIHSLLDYIIYDRENPVGLICCESTTGPREWHDNDVDYVRILTVMAGVELKTARKN